MAEATHLLGLPKKHKPKDIKPQGAGSGLDADTVDGLHASEIGGTPGAHASTHEVDGTDLVRPYLPVCGCWRITGDVSPFELEADSELELYVEGEMYFDESTGKMKVAAS